MSEKTNGDMWGVIGRRGAARFSQTGMAEKDARAVVENLMANGWQAVVLVPGETEEKFFEIPIDQTPGI